MSKLPIQSIPTYSTILPISGKTVEYRTFLVKEEKIIRLAMTSNDHKEVLNAIKQVIGLCTMGTVDLSTLVPVDLNWLMLKIRSVSKGNNVELAMKCKNIVDDKECGYINEMSVSLDNVVLKKSEIPNDTIILYDNVGVKMIPPSLDIISMLEKDDNQETQTIKTIIGSIDYIFHGEEIYNSSDVTAQDVVEFLESLLPDQLKKLTGYIEEQPSLSLEVDYHCEKCGVKHKIEVDNFADFLD